MPLRDEIRETDYREKKIK